MAEVSDKLYHKSSYSGFQDCSGQDCTVSWLHHCVSGEYSNLLKNGLVKQSNTWKRNGD